MTEAERLGYLPELDGLRALAVTAVVAYHLDLGWARGGFLGVDLFFVISGFLITALLIDEHARFGRIGVGAFWLRRFKRLTPPLVVMIAATVVATRLWGVPEQWRTSRFDAASALGYVANWRFVVAEQSYFDTLLGPGPLRHTWSLAVEEQWYLLWPLMMVGLTAVARRRVAHGRLLLITCAVVAAAIASALLMALLHRADDPSRVYYGTDTRAQHLLIGAGAAWLRAARPEWFTPTSLQCARRPFVAIGVSLAIAMVWVVDDATWLYHGGLFAISIGCAALVLAVSQPGAVDTLRWLGSPLLVAFGRRSYSVYLWHWPVIVFVGAPMGLDVRGLPLLLLRIAVTLTLSELSYRLVEQRVRYGLDVPRRVVAQWSIGALVTAMLAVVALDPPGDRGQQASAERVSSIDLDALATSEATSPVAAPTAASPTPTAAATSTTSTTSTASTNATAATTPSATDQLQVRQRHIGSPDAESPAPARPPRLLILGDSRASQLAYTLDAADTRGWDVDTYTLLGCAITRGATIDAGHSKPTRHGAHCSGWAQDWETITAFVQPDVSVVIAGAWEVLDHRVDGATLEFPSPEWTTEVTESVRLAVDRATGPDTVVAVTTLPCMQQSAIASSPALARNDADRVAAYNAIVTEVSAAHDHVVTLDLAEFLCPGGRYTPDVGGHEMFTDGVHLTPFGIDRQWTWLLDQLEAFRPAASAVDATAIPTPPLPTAPGRPHRQF